MINRIFFIGDTRLPFGGRPPGDDSFLSILADPSCKEDMERVYDLFAAPGAPSCSLTLSIRSPLSAESIRSVTSFLFMPTYVSGQGRRVILLLAADPPGPETTPGLLTEAAAALSGYFVLQGMPDVLFHILSVPGSHPGGNSGEDTIPGERSVLFRSVEELSGHYKRLLGTDRFYDNDLFFYGATEAIFGDALSALQVAEAEFGFRDARLALLVQSNQELKKELCLLKNQQAATAAELGHHRQYLEVLRSGHQAKEIQDFYNREYEILPLWYKRFGHLLKVITGKRTFLSLFRNDVKKYKD